MQVTVKVILFDPANVGYIFFHLRDKGFDTLYMHQVPMGFFEDVLAKFHIGMVSDIYFLAGFYLPKPCFFLYLSYCAFQ